MTHKLLHTNAITAFDYIKKKYSHLSAHGISKKFCADNWISIDKVSNVLNCMERGIDFHPTYAQYVRWLTTQHLDQHIDDELMSLIASFFVHSPWIFVVRCFFFIRCWCCPHLYTCERAFVTIIRVHHLKTTCLTLVRLRSSAHKIHKYRNSILMLMVKAVRVGFFTKYSCFI